MTAAEPAAGADRIRFDKWLWAARFYKTRTLAAQAVDAGQARLNDERVKPAHVVRQGDMVLAINGQEVKDVADLKRRVAGTVTSISIGREGMVSTVQFR